MGRILPYVISLTLGLALGLASGCSGLPPLYQTSDAAIYVVQARSLNVRSAPGLLNPVVGNLVRGQRVYSVKKATRIDHGETWILVSSSRGMNPLGWVSEKHLTRGENSQSSASAEGATLEEHLVGRWLDQNVLTSTVDGVTTVVETDATTDIFPNGMSNSSGLLAVTFSNIPGAGQVVFQGIISQTWQIHSGAIYFTCVNATLVPIEGPDMESALFLAAAMEKSMVGITSIEEIVDLNEARFVTRLDGVAELQTYRRLY